MRRRPPLFLGEEARADEHQHDSGSFEVAGDEGAVVAPYLIGVDVDDDRITPKPVDQPIGQPAGCLPRVGTPIADEDDAHQYLTSRLEDAAMMPASPCRRHSHNWAESPNALASKKCATSPSPSAGPNDRRPLSAGGPSSGAFGDTTTIAVPSALWLVEVGERGPVPGPLRAEPDLQDARPVIELLLGDGFVVLTEGKSRLGGDLDLDALEAYFAANSPVPPGPQDRITLVP